MKSIKSSRIVVVADSDQGRVLAARLRRMEVAEVTAVAGLEEARRLCQSGSTDVCLVALGNPVPDCVPAPEGEAPGRACGIPALMVAPVVTPHVRRTARRCGYLAVISATMPPRMLYRRLGAALQRRGAARRSSRHLALGAQLLHLENSAIFDKPTLH
jgi:CheY-like chemotaxis protein